MPVSFEHLLTRNKEVKNLVNYQLYKEQRVGVFVDVQNFYYSAKSAYNAKVNFAQILRDAIRNRKLVRAIAYVIKADVGAEKTFFEALNLMGYEVRSKDIQVFFGGAKKGDWDVGITMDCIALASKLDTVILCSGDGDFIPLVDYLQKSAGCRVEVMAFGKSASSKLKDQADAFFDLGSKKYLIGGSDTFQKHQRQQQQTTKQQTQPKREPQRPPLLAKEKPVDKMKLPVEKKQEPAAKKTAQPAKKKSPAKKAEPAKKAVPKKTVKKKTVKKTGK